MVRGWGHKQSFNKFFAAYSRALVRSDFQNAYHAAGTEFRAATTFDEFVRQHTELSRERGRLLSVKQGRTVVEGSGSPLIVVAVTTASLGFEKASVDVIYEFHFEDGEWRLFGFRRD